MPAGEMHTVRVAFARALPHQQHQLIHEAPVSVAAVLHVDYNGNLHLLGCDRSACSSTMVSPWQAQQLFYQIS